MSISSHSPILGANEGSNNAASSTSENKQKRKRNRVPLSCTICRKRKVKCDKGRPHCQQCIKTGVAHLCHYMEQSWAEEAEKEISKESELKQLRERVKCLEESLSKVHSSACSNTPESNILGLDEITSAPASHCGEEPKSISQQNKYNNDELDLTRQFDMLHLKNNGTIHLGATHWLAIMKGDPYLKLLWGHIFSVREKLAEWYSQKRKVPNQKTNHNMSATGQPARCPVDHTKLHAEMGKQQPRCPVNQQALRKCPVDHASLSENMGNMMNASSVSRCPVNHGTMTVKQEQDKTGLQLPGRPSLSNGRSLPSFENLTSKCPLTRGPFTPLNDPVNNTKQQSPPLPRPMQQQQQQQQAHSGIRDESPQSIELVTARICQLLPPKRVIFSFIDKFFKQIYPVIPIIDEQNFKHHMNQILQIKPYPNGDEEPVAQLRLTKLADFCNLGILVIILRLTWLSLPANACEINLGPGCASFLMPQATTSTISQAKEESLLNKYETPVEVLELVRERLIKFDEISSISNSNVNLTTIQFAIFYKLYLMCWANDKPTQSGDSDMLLSSTANNGGGQDNETHQVLLSSITQMAFSCGLHRDPDNFPQLNAVAHTQPDSTGNANTQGNTSTTQGNGTTKINKEARANTERFKHTWRKTWYYIVSLDVQQSLSLGTPRLLRNLKDFSDTKLPSASKIDYVRDIKELVIVKNTTLFFQIDLCIVAVLNHILNVSLAKTVRKFELDALINSLSDLTHGKKNISEVVSGLINSGLLFTTEGVVDQNSDEVYGLPSLEEILLQKARGMDNEVDKRLDLAHESTTKALFFSKHLTIRMLLYLLNYILFTHYEPMGSEDPGTTSMAKEYAQEALNYALDGYRNCMLFFNNLKTSGTTSSMFGYMEVVLAPQCLDVGHRALQFIVCLVLRAKCGPLTGMGESAIISNGVVSSSEDEHEASTSKKRETTAELDDDVAKEISLDLGESLADLLLERMILFHKMAKQACIKYHYAIRMMKSTGFFIALLRNPSSKMKHEQRIGSLLSDKRELSNMSGFLKNVPSLILSADGEQLKRCPVYQDAVGFVTPKGSTHHFSTAASNNSARIGTQLPPLRSYKPITYNSSNVRRTSEEDEPDVKRRHLSTATSEPMKLTDLVSSPLPPMQRMSPPAMASVGAPQGLGNLPPLDRIAGQLTPVPIQNTPVLNTVSNTFPNSTGVTSSNDIQFSGVGNFTSPESEVSSVHYTPAFEDFLMQNSNFNGIMINPSSIVEAVGFHNFDSGDIPMGNETVDFLPIDNTAIDGLSELAADFPVWE